MRFLNSDANFVYENGNTRRAYKYSSVSILNDFGKPYKSREVPINAKKILKGLQGVPRTGRGAITVYLNRELFKRFQKALKARNSSASAYLEELIKEVLKELE